MAREDIDGVGDNAAQEASIDMNTKAEVYILGQMGLRNCNAERSNMLVYYLWRERTESDI